MAVNVLCVGRKLTVEFAVRSDGTMPAKLFFDSLDPQDKRKLMVLFQWLADEGRIVNREKFKKVEGTQGLFEFKSFQIRMPGFFTPDRRFVITHGFRKKKDAFPKSEVEIAYRIRDENLRHQGN